MGDGVWRELHFECREVLHHECRKVSILAEGEQVLLVKGIDITFGVFFDDPIGDNERAALVGSTDAVHAEAAGQTSHRTEEGFECLREMMRNVVLINLGEVVSGNQVFKTRSTYLDHRPPGAFLIVQLCFSADRDNLCVIGGDSHQTIERFRGDGLGTR